MEAIAFAAIKLNDGTIFKAKHHGDCFAKYFAKSKIQCTTENHIQGFMTDTGRFVTRVEAGKIAFDAGQIKKDPEGGIIVSERIWFYGPYDYDEEKGYYLKQ